MIIVVCLIYVKFIHKNVVNIFQLFSMFKCANKNFIIPFNFQNVFVKKIVNKRKKTTNNTNNIYIYIYLKSTRSKTTLTITKQLHLNNNPTLS